MSEKDFRELLKDISNGDWMVFLDRWDNLAKSVAIDKIVKRAKDKGFINE